jgi:hypothetical protein
MKSVVFALKRIGTKRDIVLDDNGQEDFPDDGILRDALRPENASTDASNIESAEDIVDLLQEQYTYYDDDATQES